MSTHRYWRLLCPLGFSAIAEIEFHSTVGGADQCSGGAANASSYYGGGYEPANAFDNNAGTKWATDTSASRQWISYDFGAGSEKEIVEFKITARNDGYESQTPQWMILQYSDDASAWTNLFSTTNQTGWGSGESRTYNNTAAPDTLVALTEAGTNVRLTWTGGEASEVQRKAPGGSYSTIATTQLGQAEYLDTSPLSSGTYRIYALTSLSYSNEATADFAQDPAWATDANLELWLSRAQPAQLTDGATPTYWLDRSGNDYRQAAVGAPAAHPSSTLGLNSLGAISADGANDYFQGGHVLDFSGNAALTIFALVEPDRDLSVVGDIIGRDGSGNKGWRLSINADGTVAFFVATSSSASTYVATSKIDQHGMPAVISARYNGAAGEMGIWINGVLASGSAVGTVPSTIANTGSALRVLDSGYDFLYEGYAADIVLISAAVPDATRQSYEQDLIDAAQLYVIQETSDSGSITLGTGTELQGVACDATYAYLCGSNYISKRLLSDWSEDTANSSPFSGLGGGYNHTSDPCLSDDGNTLYTGIGDYPGGSVHYLIAEYATSDLSRTATHDINGTGKAPAGLAYDAGRSRIWGMEFGSATNEIYWFALSDLTTVGGTLTLSQTIPYMQGISYDGTYLWISTGENNSTEDYNGLIYRVDPDTGDARPVYRRQNHNDGVVGEGIHLA